MVLHLSDDLDQVQLFQLRVIEAVEAVGERVANRPAFRPIWMAKIGEIGGIRPRYGHGVECLADLLKAVARCAAEGLLADCLLWIIKHIQGGRILKALPVVVFFFQLCSQGQVPLCIQAIDGRKPGREEQSGQKSKGGEDPQQKGEGSRQNAIVTDRRRAIFPYSAPSACTFCSKYRSRSCS